MANVSLRQAQANMLRRFRQTLDKASQDMLESVKAKTPVETGETQAAWKLQADGDTRQIGNDMPHIRKLEFGGNGNTEHAMVRKTVLEASKIINRRAREAQND